MLMPKRTKYRKQHKGRTTSCISRGTSISFGKYGLKAIEEGRVSAAQIEAARQVMVRRVRKISKIWIRIFPDVPVTVKPIAVRMGKGKGSVDHWICRVSPGRVMFELGDIPFELAYEAFQTASLKLPVKTTFVKLY